jgi:hypothetical protein
LHSRFQNMTHGIEKGSRRVKKSDEHSGHRHVEKLVIYGTSLSLSDLEAYGSNNVREL